MEKLILLVDDGIISNLFISPIKDIDIPKFYIDKKH
jgi:hypothetical protein